MTASNKRTVNNGVELPPNPARLVQILASVGHTMPSAVADLVDNSISADATKIDIVFGRPDGGHGRWLTIADNGQDMVLRAGIPAWECAESKAKAEGKEKNHEQRNDPAVCK